MMKKMKKITAMLCSFALVISSLSVSTSKEVEASVTDAQNYNWSGVGWLGNASGNSNYTETLKMVKASGDGNIDNVQGAGIYHNFPDASFGELTLNGEVLDFGIDYSFNGAGVYLVPSSIEYKYSEYIVKNAGGNVKGTFYIYNKDGIDNATAPAKPTNFTISNGTASWTAAADAVSYELLLNGTTYTTSSTSYDLSSVIAGLSGGTYVVKLRTVGNNTTYSGYTRTSFTKQYSDGDELIPSNKRSSGNINVPDRISGNAAYDPQYYAENLPVESGKYYVVSYTISSTEHRWFGMKLEDPNRGYAQWYTFSPDFEVEVGAGESVVVAEVVTPDQTMSTAKVGIFMGYIHENSPATTVSITNFSLKVYDTRNAADTAAAVLLASQSSGPMRPTNLALSDGTLSWNAVAEADSYIIKIGDTVISNNYTSTSIDLTTNLAGLAYGTHTISVIAQNTSGESTAATISYTKVDPRPQMVSNPSISLINDDTVVLVAGLDTIQNATTYNLYVDGDLYGSVTNGANIPVSDFTAGEHLFQVTGVNSYGESSKSTGYTLTIPGVAPVQQSAPTGFAATLANSNTEVQISWTAPAGDCYLYIDDVRYDNGANGVVTNGSYVNIASTLNTTTKLTAGNHTFKIATITSDTFGESEKTEAIQINIPQTAPTEAQDLQVTDGIGKLTVYFTETSAMKKAAQKYSIYVDGAISQNKVSQGQYEITGLAAGSHTVTVKSHVLSNEAGHTSEYIDSTGVSDTGTVYELNDPTNVSATGGTNVINLTWSDSIATSDYKIYLDGAASPALTTAVGATSAQLTGVSAGTHSVTIKAHVLNAESTGVTVNSIMVYAPATAVSAITINAGYNTFTASWDDNGATAYVITIKNSSNETVALTGSGVTENGVVTYTYTGVTADTYSYSVKAQNAVGDLSAATVESVTVHDISDQVLTSSDIAVYGFQIKLNNAEVNNVGFRTVCKAPAVGQTITVDDHTYTVASIGTIYGKDTNKTGYKENNVYNSSVTILNPAGVENQQYAYVGKNYEGTTYGYLATSAAVMQDLSTDSVTYYATTMQSTNGMLADGFHIRAFVVATDGTIIYGQKTAVISIAQIANNMYVNSMARSITGHQYLYDAILHTNELQVAENRYYRDETIEYGWNSSIYTPNN